MRREGRFVLVATLATAGLAAGILVPGGGASSKASDATSHSMATTRVTVTATDSTFTLSKRIVLEGTEIFTVTNKGKVSHDFKIAGKKTPLLAPGRSATLRVTLSNGRYPYFSTVSGQAAHGMKGVLRVVAAVPPRPAPTTTAPPSGPVGTANTTVTVDMFDTGGPPRFVLSQSTIPSGMVTFVITSYCDLGCTFNLEGIKAGAFLITGKSETWTVGLAPGIYRYHCDNAPELMFGSLTVTP